MRNSMRVATLPRLVEPVFARLPIDGGNGGGTPPVGKPYVYWNGKYWTADMLRDVFTDLTPELLEEKARMGLAFIQKSWVNGITDPRLRVLAQITLVGLDMAIGPYLRSIIADYEGFYQQALGEQVMPRLVALTPMHSRSWPSRDRIKHVETRIYEAAVSTGGRQNRMTTPVSFFLAFDTPVRIGYSMWAHDVFLGIGNIACDVAIWGKEGNTAVPVFHERVKGSSYIIDGGQSARGQATRVLKAGEYMLMTSAGYSSSAKIKVTYEEPTEIAALPVPVWLLVGLGGAALAVYLSRRRR